MKSRFLLFSVGLAVLTFLAHGPGLGGDWVYDDHRFIRLNPALEEIDVVRYFTDASSASASEGIQHDIYRPLRTLSFAADRQLFGVERDGRAPPGWHLHSLLLHALAAILVLRLLLGLAGGRWWAAGAGAAIFAVHPVTVECVAWVSSRGDLLAVVLMVATLLILERAGTWRTILGALTAALACFAKESALVLPALLFLRDLALPADRRPAMGTTWLRVGALALVAGLYLAARLQVIPGLAQVEYPGGSLSATMRGMLAGLAWYGQALVWPSGFAFDIHLPVPPGFADPRVVLGAGLLLTTVAAGAWGLRGGRERRLLTFAAWGALACLVPVSNVIVPLKALVAERFLYPALVCVVAGVAWVVGRIPARRRWIGCVAVAALVAIWIPLTRERTETWKDGGTLWEAVLRDRPSHMPAYAGLGWEYDLAGRVRSARKAYRSYLDYNPTDGKAWKLLGDLIGKTARSLQIRRPREGVEVEGMDAKRRQVRQEQLVAYGKAIRIWNTLGDAQGRGSDALRREAYGGILEAAWDMGGLRLADAKRANDRLIRLEGIDPADGAAVDERASIVRRRARLDLALKAVADEEAQRIPERDRENFARLRTVLLEDVGVSREPAGKGVLAALLDRYRGLWDDPRADVTLGDTMVRILLRLGRRGEAERTYREMRSRFPGSPLLQGPPR